jgi:predicted ribosome quality control (RQC) complex YloA/Tae2 family protein
MSLNWKEIDLVLSELDVPGAKIERIAQPSFDSLALGLYKSGRSIELFVSIAQGACRIHSLSSPPPRNATPLRFQDCLRARLVGGRIESAVQLGSERILRFDISTSRLESASSRAKVYKPLGPEARKGAKREVEELPSLLHYILYLRLWSGAGNVLLVDEEGLIVDVMARRPKRDELSGKPCRIEEELAAEPKRTKVRDFEPRDLPPLEDREGGGSFNERLEAHYAQKGGELSRESLLEEARERFAKKSRALDLRISELNAKAVEFRDAERLRELGDILMANQGRAYEGKYLSCADFYRGGEIIIPVDPALSTVENARSFYERHRKARTGLSEVEEQIESAVASLARLKRELDGLEKIEDPFLLARELAKGGPARGQASGASKKRAYPGLSLGISDWTILIGRSAKENDELLRRHVKGSDIWLHSRDWPGSYVFVKARKGKSVPLDILLDAGKLAIYYSKGRSNGGGELYYTFAKYLRRAKGGPKGLVIPTQEKNLSVKLDEARLKELRSLIGEE